MRFRTRVPSSQAVRIVLGVALDRSGRPSVGVPFAKHRVDGAAEHLGVAGPDFLFGIVFRVLGIVRNIVALRLQFPDRRLQLRNGCTDIRQLDDVRLFGLRQFTELREIIRNTLLPGQVFGKVRDDPACQRNVPGFDIDTSAFGESLDNRQKRVRRQGRSLVNLGINDFRHCIRLF